MKKLGYVQGKLKDRVIERELERMLLFGNDVKKKILQNFCKLPKWLPLLSSLDNETEIFKKVQYITRKTLTFERVKPPRSFILYLNCDVF